VQHDPAIPGAVDRLDAAAFVTRAKEDCMEDARRRDIALFRYALVRQCVEPGLSSRERGRLVRDLAARDHVGPDGQLRRVGRSTLDDWIRAYRAGGFDALVPAPRRTPLRSDLELLDLAAALKREQPDRTAVQLVRLLTAAHPDRCVPSPRTISRHLARLGIDRTGRAGGPAVFGRFEAARRNDRWTGDAMHGPVVDGAKAILFAFIDDHSRLAVGHRWGRGEDSVRLEAALRRGLAARGVPATIYVDNGSAFISAQLARTCAVLGVKLVHSRPGQPQGRGKIERFFRTVRGQFMVEAAARPPRDIDELNELFTAWVEQVYHRAVHRETGATPLDRFFADGPPDLPAPALLHEAFLWSTTRTVTKTATVSLLGNRYETDPVLAGRKVEVIYDPFDLTAVEVRHRGQTFGTATPHVVGTHVHPRAVAALEPDDLPANPGIDYLALVRAAHDRATRRTINFADLPTVNHERDGNDGDGDPPPREPVDVPLPFPNDETDPR
jgi:putative transposase